MKTTLKAPESKCLKLEHEKTLSNFAFRFNLRRYSKEMAEKTAMDMVTMQTVISFLNLVGGAG